MRRCVVGVAGLVLLLGGLAGAEDGADGRVLNLAGGQLRFELPEGWAIGVSKDAHGFEARSPQRDGESWVWFTGRHRPRYRHETFDRYVARALQEARGARILDDGFRVMDQQDRKIAGHDGRLVLVERPQAAPPQRTLFAVLTAGGGWVLRFDMALGQYPQNRERILRILEPPSAPDGSGVVRRFHHEIPPIVALRSIGAPGMVARANEKGLFRTHEMGAWNLANDAWEATQEEAARLTKDASYRSAVQKLANVALDPRFEGKYWSWAWSAPYLVLVPSDVPLSKYDLPLDGASRKRVRVREVLREGVKAQEHRAPVTAILERLYGFVMTRIAPRHGLKDLRERWGGRPDLKRNARSFPDGVPLAVFVHTDAETMTKLASTKPWFPPRPNTVVGVSPDRTELHVVRAPAEGDEAWHQRVATAASQHLLWWFTRQRSHWHSPHAAGLVEDGYAAWLGSVVMEDSGAFLVKRARELDRGVRKAGFPGMPVPPLETVLQHGDPRSFVRLIRSKYGMGGGEWLREILAYALVAYLHQTDEDGFHGLLEALLDRQLHASSAKLAVMKALGIRNDDDWEALDARWRTWVRQKMLGYEPPPPPPGDAAQAQRVRRIRVDVADDRTISVRGGARRGRGEVVRLTFADRRPNALAAQLVQLRNALRSHVEAIRAQEKDARIELKIQAAAFVPWQDLQWILQVAAAPHIAIRRITLGHRRGGSGHTVELPADRGLVRVPAIPLRPVKVRMLRPAGDRAHTDVVVGKQRVPVADLEALKPMLRDLRKRHDSAPVQLMTPPAASGAPIPWQEVAAVLDLLTEVGYGPEEILFEGSMPPTRRAR